MTQNRLKLLVALLSVVSNSVLVIIKLIVGFAIGSISVISEAIHSGVDVFAAIVAVVGVQRSSEPADREHAFGHGKFDNVSGLFQALLIFVAAGWILWEGVIKLIKPMALEAPMSGVMVMLISAVVNAVVARILFVVGNKTDSLALKADAWHCWTDVYTSAGVMAGLGTIWLGERFFPSLRLYWVDPVAAIVVALFIVRAAWNLTRESLRDLLDVSIPASEEDEIKSILTGEPRVKGFHNFRTRKSGIVRLVEFHIYVEPGMPVSESHKLNHEIAAAVRTRFPGAQVMVHIEPCKPIAPS
jgi:cation diffusion facilitator family transporter